MNFIESHLHCKLLLQLLLLNKEERCPISEWFEYPIRMQEDHKAKKEWRNKGRSEFGFEKFSFKVHPWVLPEFI